MSKRLEKNRSKRKKQRDRWITTLLGLGGLALLVVAFLALRGGNNDPKAAIEVTGAPSIKVDKEQVDLGDVKLDQPVKVTFQLTNVGDQPLRLEKEPYIEVVEGC